MRLAMLALARCWRRVQGAGCARVTGRARTRTRRRPREAATRAAHDLPAVPLSSEVRSASNSYVKHLAKLQKSTKYRREYQTYVFVGDKPLREALPLLDVRAVLARDPDDWRDVAPNAAPLVRASAAVLDKLSGVSNADAVTAVAECHMPPHTRYPPDAAIDRLLVLDGVQDPGNAGTLLRTAAALGWTHIFLAPGCCDIYNDKLLRAMRGGLAQLDVVEGDASALQGVLDEHGLALLVADMDGAAAEDAAVDDAARVALALGAEGMGVSKEIRALADRTVGVPIARGAMESLNVGVAGGILMYGLRRR